ncbi:MAG TPA: ABC transporter substrate-binding protein [Alphaproteobacteria bacterium]|nr:ABC transporter substrate-binding protein [Alphaproteobacteria bacterium]
MKAIGRSLLALAVCITMFGAAAMAQTTIRMATPYKATVLDPTKSAAAGEIELFGQLYARLLRRSADGKLEPGLAESWEVSDDGKKFVFRLREAKFSDGSPLTAADVAFSLSRALGEGSAYPAPFSAIESVEAEDERTVVVNLKAPAAPFLGYMEIFNAGIVSKADVEARGPEKAFTENPVTSGPFMVKEWKPNDRLILERNPHYWRTGHPKVDQVALIEVADTNTRIAMLQGGEIDVARDAPFAQVGELDASDKIDVPLHPSTVIYMTLLNHGRAPFNDIRVRQAAAHALDVSALTKAVTHGHATPANTTLPEALLFHHKDYPGISQDVAKAKALLAEAGAPQGEAVIMVTAGSVLSEQLAVLIQAQWAAVGLKSKIEKVDVGLWWDRLTTGDYDAAPSWWYNETEDPDLAARWALCGACGNKSFYTNYNNETVNQLTEQALNEIDPEKRKALYIRMQEISTEEVSQIPLYYPPYTNAYSTRVKGLMLSPALQWNFEDAEIVE